MVLAALAGGAWRSLARAELDKLISVVARTESRHARTKARNGELLEILKKSGGAIEVREAFEEVLAVRQPFTCSNSVEHMSTSMKKKMKKELRTEPISSCPLAQDPPPQQEPTPARV